jgi:hypothetical protein
MNRFLIAILTVLLWQSQAQSQATETPKFEVAAEFTTLARDSFGGRTDPGFGARFTYNLNRVVSLETAGYFFPQKCFSCNNNGNVTEVVGGVKIGKRFEHWGIFGKARPGVVSFSRGKGTFIPNPGTPWFPFEFIPQRLNNFAADVGGVAEFYPSKRVVVRFDLGDTIIHFGKRQVQGFVFEPTTNTFTIVPFTQSSRTTHNFQFVTSVGWRF